MKLSELFLNRFLCKDTNQSSETQDASTVSADSTSAEPASIPSGGAAQDINQGNVTINGSQLTPGTIPQTTLDVSNWGWWQTCAFSSSSSTVVAWASGDFVSASGVTYSISAGSTPTMSAKTYIYLDLNVSETAYQTTTTASSSVGVGKVLIAIAQNATAGNATYNLNQASQIVSDNILTNSIDASRIVAGSITATQMTAATINAMNIVAGSVAAENITGTYITGKTIRTDTAGDRMELTTDSYISNNNPALECYDGADCVAAVRPLIGVSGNGMVMESYIPGTTTVSSIISSLYSSDGGISGGARRELTFAVNGDEVMGLYQDQDYGNIKYLYISNRIDGNLSPVANNSANIGTSSYRWNTIYLINDPNVSSSKEGKQNIKNVVYGLKDVLKMNPVSFTRKHREKEYTNRKKNKLVEKEIETENVGFIAEDLHKIVPEVSDETSYRPTQLIPILVKAIQELNQKVTNLQAQVDNLTV